MRRVIKQFLRQIGILDVVRTIKRKIFPVPEVHGDLIQKEYIKQFLPSRPVVIDAGAHKGGDSIEICELIHDASIHSFEPVPAIFTELKLNTRPYPQITCYNMALSNRTGEQTMNISGGNSDASSSLLKPKEHLTDHPGVNFDKSISVETITLDDWAKKFNIDKVDFLWLDMQGFELEMLKASTKILPGVKVIHLEVSTRETYESAPLYPEVKEWLTKQGFIVQLEAIPEKWDMGNVLFIRVN